MRGYESEEGYIQKELLKTLSEGDLVLIEYYAPKYNKRLTTLFVVILVLYCIIKYFYMLFYLVDN